MLCVPDPIAPADRLRALCIEADADAAALMVRVLKRSGYLVTVVRGVPEGEAAAGPFALLIADTDGGSLLRALRSRGPVKAIALTGTWAAADRLRSAAAGFDRHLNKPVSADRLRRTVSSV